jgi:hypothetical protein
MEGLIENHVIRSLPGFKISQIEKAPLGTLPDGPRPPFQDLIFIVAKFSPQNRLQKPNA